MSRVGKLPISICAASLLAAANHLRRLISLLLGLAAICGSLQKACADDPIVVSHGTSVAASGAADQTADRFLLALGAPVGSHRVTVYIPTNGEIHLTLIRMSPAVSNETIAIHLDDPSGETTGVRLPLSHLTTNLVFTPDQSVATIDLNVSPPDSHDKFITQLILTGLGFKPIIWEVDLQRPSQSPVHPASLSVIPSKLTFTHAYSPFKILNKWLFGSPNAIDSTVTLVNSNRDWPITQIAVVPGDLTTGDHDPLNFSKDLSFHFNGTNAPDLTRLPSATPHGIPAGGQAVLGISLGDLSPGEYTFELDLRTMDTTDDPIAQKLTVDVKVRHTVGFALLVLILGLVGSFVSYRWITLYKQKTPLLQQIYDLQASMPLSGQKIAIFPIVWIGMSLRLADQLVRKFLLTPPAHLTDRLEQTQSVIDAMSVVQKMDLEMAKLDLLVKNRFTFEIDDIIQKMQTRRMTSDAAKEATATLEELYKVIIDPSKRADFYWKRVSETVAAFRCKFDEIKNNWINTLAGRPEQAILANFISTAEPKLWPIGGIPTATPSLTAMLDYEATYTRLWLIHERKDNPSLALSLIKNLVVPIEEYLKFVDEETWKIIQNPDTRLEISPPSFLHDNVIGHTYETLLFTVTSSNEEVNKSYLFRRLLQYEWALTLCSRPWWRLWMKRTITFRPVTNLPGVTQFMPHEGKLTISVRLKNARCETKDSPRTTAFDVKKSPDVSFLGKLERADRLSFFIAGGFAISSGLLTFYYKNPVFGSARDYITLFIWGFGVDLTKNFLQSSKVDPPS